MMIKSFKIRWGARSIHGKDKKYKFWLENLKGKRLWKTQEFVVAYHQYGSKGNRIKECGLDSYLALLVAYLTTLFQQLGL
jgi:hypothetical protein